MVADEVMNGAETDIGTPTNDTVVFGDAVMIDAMSSQLDGVMNGAETQTQLTTVAHAASNSAKICSTGSSSNRTVRPVSSESLKLLVEKLKMAKELAFAKRTTENSKIDKRKITRGQVKKTSKQTALSTKSAAKRKSSLVVSSQTKKARRQTLNTSSTKSAAKRKSSLAVSSQTKKAQRQTLNTLSTKSVAKRKSSLVVSSQTKKARRQTLNTSNVEPKRQQVSWKASDKHLAEKRQKEAERKRKQREKIKNNPEAYRIAKLKEKARRHRRKQTNGIKSVLELTSREQRKLQKTWRVNSLKYRNKRRVPLSNGSYVQSPPASCPAVMYQKQL